MPGLLLFLALTVKQNNTPLRNGCASDADQIATLPAGAALTIRFSLQGESTPCFKVAADSSGQTIEGYLPGDSIDGLEEFDQARRAAAWVDVAQAITEVRATKAATATGQGLLDKAVGLIEGSQPGRALELLEPEIRKHKDPALLAAAGFAAWRADDSHRAVEYLRSSLEIQPSASIENLYRQVEREAKSDQSTEKVYGLHVVLRYEAGTVPVETARQMVSVLDSEYSRISAQLGCTAEERIVAIAQSRDAYRKTTDAAEWSGGQFDGRIRVPVFNGVDAQMRRTLAHETTHACLAMLGSWPAWLQEGMAQKLSGETLSPAVKQKLSDMSKEGKLPKLASLGQDWSRMDTEHAVLAYGMSLAAVEQIYQSYGQSGGIGNLMRNPARINQIASELDR